MRANKVPAAATKYRPGSATTVTSAGQCASNAWRTVCAIVANDVSCVCPGKPPPRSGGGISRAPDGRQRGTGSLDGVGVLGRVLTPAADMKAHTDHAHAQCRRAPQDRGSLPRIRPEFTTEGHEATHIVHQDPNHQGGTRTHRVDLVHLVHGVQCHVRDVVQLRDSQVIWRLDGVGQEDVGDTARRGTHDAPYFSGRGTIKTRTDDSELSENRAVGVTFDGVQRLDPG